MGNNWLERDECIILLKKFPSEICDNFGEYYLSDAVTEKVLEKAELAVNNRAE
ncbi:MULTISPECIES: hypothetical protein [Nostoc]|uniref:Uncharacterized protein n=1 Tax=Nostoc paludosum FACHB-159 TaxID=2692908 RepID=A0ABR8K2N2_9NOSO|nr:MULTISPECIES: hypothetical protein [Nostoc]MBD2676988.1 hypothetical protein [Nostoc sp. FACHB-857]MBD2733188.1 hypothetical protein [Nostoc paludosum FACHB-159]